LKLTDKTVKVLPLILPSSTPAIFRPSKGVDEVFGPGGFNKLFNKCKSFIEWTSNGKNAVISYGQSGSGKSH
jgi:hypothetical protein